MWLLAPVDLRLGLLLPPRTYFETRRGLADRRPGRTPIPPPGDRLTEHGYFRFYLFAPFYDFVCQFVV
jgi:hypothetical protein